MHPITQLYRFNNSILSNSTVSYAQLQNHSIKPVHYATLSTLTFRNYHLPYATENFQYPLLSSSEWACKYVRYFFYCIF